MICSKKEHNYFLEKKMLQKKIACKIVNIKVFSLYKEGREMKNSERTNDESI